MHVPMAGFGRNRGCAPRALQRTGCGAVAATGFTLLEMLVVLGLVATASVLAMAAFAGGLDGMRLRAAAGELAAQLRYTRAVAMASGRPQEFRIDPRTRQWHAPKGRHGQLPATGELVFTGATGARLGLAHGEADLGVVRFFPDGAASGGRLRLQANGGGWSVEIAWLTGEVHLQRLRTHQ